VGRWRSLSWPAGIAIGVAAEWARFGWHHPGRWLPDLLVGWIFIACGLIASARRPESRSGGLLAATGVAWFLPNFAGLGSGLMGRVAASTLFWHRGPLVHLVLTYPDGRTSSRLTQSAVLVGYAAAIVYPVWQNEGVAIALAASLVAVSAWRYRVAIGPARRARRIALQAMSVLGLLFAGEATVRLSVPSSGLNGALLLGYEATLLVVAIWLAAGLLVRPWERASVTDLVVELGRTRSGTLRDELARALGDPSLEVGYWLSEANRFVDSRGRSFDLPDPTTERSTTLVERGGRPIAALVHHPSVLTDRGLIEAVSSAAKLAASNARLQADVRARQAEIRVSRQRILEAGDEERGRLERRLREGAQRWLDQLGETLRAAQSSAGGETNERIGKAEEQLAKTKEELHRLALGIHPGGLSEQGLGDALASLVADLPLPVDLAVSPDPVPPRIADCSYFLCAEALANVAKHASATNVRVSVASDPDQITVEIEDDGVGGADPARGTGLRGLADRVETLGGTLKVTSGRGRGTRLTAAIPTATSRADD
jgi:signal transduction histidine kinase